MDVKSTDIKSVARYVILLLYVALPVVAVAKPDVTVVVDSKTGEPLAKASVFDCRGQFVGLTSMKGIMPYAPESAYPLLLRYVGYEPETVADRSAPKVLMRESVANLPEVVVSSGVLKALHILGYVREYSTLTTYTDTVMLFREKMVDFMIPEKDVRKFKGWTLPRMLSSRSYYNFRNSAGLDSVSDAFPEHFSWSDWVGVIKTASLPPALQHAGNATDTVRGRWTASRIWRRSGDRIYLDVDILSDTLNRSYVPQLAGFIRKGIDFRRLDIRYIFDNCGDGEVTADNISAMSFNIESQGRGRNLERLFSSKGSPYVETYVELYIVDKEYIPIKEARKWEKFTMEGDGAAILVPDGIPELPPSAKDLIARVENIDVAETRLRTEIDPRIGHLVVFRWDILSRLKRMAKGFIGLK